MSIIQQLIRSGACVLWHHYKRHAVDLSGNGNDGAHTSTKFTGTGLQFSSASGNITVADSAELQTIEGALIVKGKFSRALALNTLISKRDAGGANYHWSQTAAGFTFYDGADSRSLAASTAGLTFFGINFGNGTIAEGYTENGSIGAYSDVSAVSVNDAPVVIGNYYLGGRVNVNPFEDVLITSRKLTTAEYALINAELISLQHAFDARPYEIAGGTKFVQRDGVFESTATAAADSMVTNSGWRNGTATTDVVHEVVGGKLRPVFECATAGKLSIPTSRFHQTPGQAAHGTFEFWLNKSGETNVLQMQFIASGPTGGAGYDLTINADESVTVNETGVGAKFATAAAQVANGTWHKYRVEITDPAGVFTTYIDDVLAVADSGTNPFTDVTTAVSTHAVADPDAGDKVCGLTKDIA